MRLSAVSSFEQLTKDNVTVNNKNDTILFVFIFLALISRRAQPLCSYGANMSGLLYHYEAWPRIPLLLVEVLRIPWNLKWNKVHAIHANHYTKSCIP